MAIDSDSQDAERGLQRAQRREQVVGYVGEAKQAEASKDWNAARVSYAKALELDAQYGPARSGLDRAAAQLAERAFADAMGHALSALAASQLDEAAVALKAAGKLRPDDKALAEARQQLLLARRGARVTALRSQAAARVKAEDWQAAVNLYEQALSVVPDALFARDGLVRARERMALHKRIDAYLHHPTRLYSLEPLADAEHLLSGVGQVPADEPVLARKAEKLARQITQARVPLAVTLRSDGETDVMIYRVDRLGRFQEREVELRPGIYTVVGSRPGYRDVRRQLSVRPGVSPAPLMIRCTEPI